MKSWRMWPVYAVGAALLLLAVALFVPSISLAGTNTPVNGQTGICVEGAVVDTSHEAIKGIVVSASMQGGQPMTTTTNTQGAFRFDQGILPGTYAFSITIPSNWQAVTPLSVPLDVAYGHGTCYKIGFKVTTFGGLIVHKQDVRGNPLQGWKITVTGLVDPTMLTDASGNAVFEGLPPGDYLVTEEVPYPWQAVTPPGNPQKVTVPVARSRADYPTVTFVNENRPTSCVTGQKVDADHNPLGGWTILATPAYPGAPTFQTTTDPQGNFTFPNLTLGTWVISEQVMPGWTPVTPSHFNVTLTNPSAPPNCEVVRFKNRAPDLCIKVKKVDENGNPLSGWGITIHPTVSNTQVIQPDQQANGIYWFYNLTPQTYAVAETLKPGWTQVSVTPSTVKPAPFPCATVTVVNRSPRCTIDVYKRDDLQAPLAGWQMTLLSASNAPLKFGTTDGVGHVQFSGLTQGMYWVKETMQNGWMPLTPPLQPVNLAVNADGQCRATVNFVNRQVPRDICIEGKKWDVGRNVGLAGVVITATLQGANPPVVSSTTTSGDGSYRFSNLTPGTYTVTFQEPDGFFNVGPTSKTVTVNWPPKLRCEGRADFFDRQGKPPVKPPTCDKWSCVPPKDTCRAYHVVKPGQTLSGIAASYGASVGSLMNANGIWNADYIRSGQKLCIP